MQPYLMPDIRAARLSAAEYAKRFADATPRLTQAQAVLEAERCLYCTTRLALRHALPVLTYRHSSNELQTATCAVLPRLFWTATQWAACARGFARLKTFARPCV